MRILLLIALFLIAGAYWRLKKQQQSNRSKGFSGIILKYPEDALILPKGSMGVASKCTFTDERISVPTVTNHYRIDFDRDMVLYAAKHIMEKPFYRREYRYKRFIDQAQIVTECGTPNLIEMAYLKGLPIKKIGTYNHPESRYLED